MQTTRVKEHSVARITTNINPVLEQEVQKRKAKNVLASTTDIIYQLLGERLAEIREQEQREREIRVKTVNEIHEILGSYQVSEQIKNMSQKELDNFLESNF